MKIHESLASAIRKMALIESQKERMLLREAARNKTLEEWKSGFNWKVGGVGILTGIMGGPVGLALEAGDIAYLLAACGRACYGIGYICRDNVDYDNDMPIILGIWAGAAEATAAMVAGKVSIKIGGKAALIVGTQVGAKLMEKVIPKVATKLAAKYVTKVSTKWIPVIGGAVSAGINYWVANGIMEAAEQYYKGNYVILDENLGAVVKDLIGYHIPVFGETGNYS